MSLCFYKCIYERHCCITSCDVSHQTIKFTNLQIVLFKSLSKLSFHMERILKMKIELKEYRFIEISRIRLICPSVPGVIAYITDHKLERYKPNDYRWNESKKWLWTCLFRILILLIIVRINLICINKPLCRGYIVPKLVVQCYFAQNYMYMYMSVM